MATWAEWTAAHPGHRAWTGGTFPAALGAVPTAERRYVSRLFREQCEEYIGFTGGELPGDIGRVFWRRARRDAHATFRGRGIAPTYLQA